jgi:Na+/proline symporter
MHYAIRPWPWIIVALGSLIIYPDLASIGAEFPDIPANYLKDDIAYPVMMTKLGKGWIGLVVASIFAAYMSTIGTHLNWGSSYVVNDFYRRFVKPDSSEKHLVMVGRIMTVVLMVLAGLVALFVLNNATQAFNILILSGAGTGAIYLLRWFWWRINAMTEIVSMIFATIAALVLVFLPEGSFHSEILDEFTIKLLIAIGMTTIVWLLTTLLTKPEDMDVLVRFYKLTRPGGPGWKKVAAIALKRGEINDDAETGAAWEMPIQLLSVFLGSIAIYSSLFAIGSFVYLDFVLGSVFSAIALFSTFVLFKQFGKLGVRKS